MGIIFLLIQYVKRQEFVKRKSKPEMDIFCKEDDTKEELPVTFYSDKINHLDLDVDNSSDDIISEEDEVGDTIPNEIDVEKELESPIDLNIDNVTCEENIIEDLTNSSVTTKEDDNKESEEIIQELIEEKEINIEIIQKEEIIDTKEQIEKDDNELEQPIDSIDNVKEEIITEESTQQKFLEEEQESKEEIKIDVKILEEDEYHNEKNEDINENIIIENSDIKLQENNDEVISSTITLDKKESEIIQQENIEELEKITEELSKELIEEEKEINIEIIQKEGIIDNSKEIEDTKEKIEKDDKDYLENNLVQIEDSESVILSEAQSPGKKKKRRRKDKSRRKPRKGKKLEKHVEIVLPEQNLEKQRIIIANEILSTERTYVAGLSTLLDSYLKPLRSQNIISAASIRRIFSDIEVLYGFNCQFLTNLETRMKDWQAHNQKLGDIFLKEADYLKMYTMYVNNYNQSVKEVAECRKKNPKFGEFLDTTRYTEECKGLDITSYLIMPVQRIPRYVLLLADLLKNTPEDHLDYSDIKASVVKTKEIADYVNEKKREAENLNQVVAIQELMLGKIDLLEDASRRYVREGPLIDIGDTRRKGYYFLFNDILVVTTQSNKEFRDSWRRSTGENNGNRQTINGLKYKATIELLGTRLNEASPNLQKLDDKWKNMFQLVLPTTDENSESKIYSFLTPSYDLKVTWMGDIDDCISLQLENRKMRLGAFTNYDMSNEKGFPSKAGLLSLQHSLSGEWKSRHFVLRDGILQWFKGDDLSITKGSLEIYSCSVRLLRPSEREFAFQIMTSKRIYYVAASSGEELFEWISSIRTTIEKLMAYKEQIVSKAPKYNNVPPTIAQMLTDETNQKCADCSVPWPKWANVTFGVFLCDECYNLHKILSGSILKSLTRARWSDAQVSQFMLKGNLKVNEELETENLPPKITCNSSYECRVDYIKEKYSFYDYGDESIKSESIVHGNIVNLPAPTGQKSGWLVSVNDNENKTYYYILKKSSICYYKSDVS